MKQETQVSTPETNQIICSQLLQDTDVAHGEAMEPAFIPTQVPLSVQASVSTRDKVLTSLQHSPVVEDRLGDFIFGLEKIFTDKMAEGKAGPNHGWSAREIMDEVTREQNLTAAEQSIAWQFLTADMLGYTQEKLQDLEDGWQRSRKLAIAWSKRPRSKKPTRQPTNTLH